MNIGEDTDEGFLMYVWLHSETERALFSREHVLRLLKLANVPESQYSLPLHFLSVGTFVAVHSDIAQPLVERARRQLKRQTPQLELPFDAQRGAENYLL